MRGSKFKAKIVTNLNIINMMTKSSNYENKRSLDAVNYRDAKK